MYLPSRHSEETPCHIQAHRRSVCPLRQQLQRHRDHLFLAPYHDALIEWSCNLTSQLWKLPRCSVVNQLARHTVARRVWTTTIVSHDRPSRILKSETGLGSFTVVWEDWFLVLWSIFREGWGEKVWASGGIKELGYYTVQSKFISLWGGNSLGHHGA